MTRAGSATSSRVDRAPRPLSVPLALTLVFLTGVNIRAVFGVTPPLVPAISADLGLSSTAASLLTSVPILAMAGGAPLGHLLSSRFGGDRTMTGLLVLLSAAELSRVAMSSTPPLVVSAAFIGVALGCLSTLTPALIAHHLPGLPGLATGVYATAMAVGVGLAAGTALPVADLLGGWRGALAVWGLLPWALVAGVAWARWRGAGIPVDRSSHGQPFSLPLREGRAWFLTALYSVPMFLGFGVIAWLPTLFVENGISPSTAGLYLVCFQAVQLVSILGLTHVTDRTTGRRAVFAVAMTTSTVGLTLLVLDPVGVAIPGLLLAGFGIGGGSGLALVKVQDEAVSLADATRLSSMTMLFSFAAGATGPFLAGLLRDHAGSLRPAFAMFLGVSALSLLLLVRMRPARTSQPAGDKTLESMHINGLESP